MTQFRHSRDPLLPRDGSRPMLADLDLGDQGIDNVGDGSVRFSVSNTYRGSSSTPAPSNQDVQFGPTQRTWYSYRLDEDVWVSDFHQSGFFHFGNQVYSLGTTRFARYGGVITDALHGGTYHPFDFRLQKLLVMSDQGQVSAPGVSTLIDLYVNNARVTGWPFDGTNFFIDINLNYLYTAGDFVNWRLQNEPAGVGNVGGAQMYGYYLWRRVAVPNDP